MSPITANINMLNQDAYCFDKSYVPQSFEYVWNKGYVVWGDQKIKTLTFTYNKNTVYNNVCSRLVKKALLCFLFTYQD